MQTQTKHPNKPAIILDVMPGAEIKAVITRAFGGVPDDVLIASRVTPEVFAWLESMFKSIKAEADKKDPDRQHIASLAGAGAHLAFSHAEHISCLHEQMADHLATVGIEVTK